MKGLPVGAFDKGLGAEHELGDYLDLEVPGLGIIRNFDRPYVVRVDYANPQGWRATELKVTDGQLIGAEKLHEWLELDESNHALVSHEVITYFMINGGSQKLNRMFTWRKAWLEGYAGIRISAYLNRYTFTIPDGTERIALGGTNDQSRVP